MMRCLCPPCSLKISIFPLRFHDEDTTLWFEIEKETRLFECFKWRLDGIYDVYQKIAREVIPHQAIFILGCGCDVKNLGPAMLVYPTASRIHMKRYLPTLLLLIILSTFISFSVVFFLHNGLGKSLCLIGYILLAASILSFLFFLSIDPGYGWVKSANLHKNHRFVFLFIILFIISIGFIVLGLQLSASHPRLIDTHGRAEQMGHTFPVD